MGAVLGTEQIIQVGLAVVIDSVSHTTPYAVVFEDDGATGYFYGLDQSREGNTIVDALHIYNVANVSDRQIPSKIQIFWSEDGLKTALVINNFPHAVFDFSANRAYCRTGFPPPDKSWTTSSHEWDDSVMELFH